jgi:hypothetical protein
MSKEKISTKTCNNDLKRVRGQIDIADLSIYVKGKLTGIAGAVGCTSSSTW